MRRPSPLARLTIGLQALLALALLLVHLGIVWWFFLRPMLDTPGASWRPPNLLSLLTMLVIAAPVPALIVLLGVLRDRWLGRRGPYGRRQRGVTLLFLAIGLLSGLALTILSAGEQLAVLPALGTFLGLLQIGYVAERAGWARTTPGG